VAYRYDFGDCWDHDLLVEKIHQQSPRGIYPRCSAGGRACHGALGVFVDHDPESMFVRGLVCRHCNTHLEECPHSKGCVWGDYLNHPPAAPLSLRYPRAALSRKAKQPPPADGVPVAIAENPTDMGLTCMDGLWARRPVIVFLKEFPQVSSNTVGFCSIATGTPAHRRGPCFGTPQDVCDERPDAE
jgi:hypothetical protein